MLFSHGISFVTKDLEIWSSIAEIMADWSHVRPNGLPLDCQLATFGCESVLGLTKHWAAHHLAKLGPSGVGALFRLGFLRKSHRELNCVPRRAFGRARVPLFLGAMLPIHCVSFCRHGDTWNGVFHYSYMYFVNMWDWNSDDEMQMEKINEQFIWFCICTLCIHTPVIVWLPASFIFAWARGEAPNKHNPEMAGLWWKQVTWFASIIEEPGMSGHCVVNSWTSIPSTTISLVSLSPKWCPNSVNVSVVCQWARLPFKSTMHTMCKTLALQISSTILRSLHGFTTS